jgi:transmembrane sensor
MLRVSQVDSVLREFDGWKDIAPLDSQPPANVVTLDVVREHAEPAKAAPRRVRWWLPAAIAAGVATLAVGFWSMNVAGWERVETGTAERRELALADGSVVQLAPNSKLRIHLQSRMREIVLSQGGAFFRVARDGRPFIVETEHASVRATGTAFAVERAREAVVVTVAEGKVVVQRPQTAGQAGVALGAGQQVVAPDSGQVEAPRAVDAARELAWTLGHLIFDRDRVFDAADRFNRYNKTQMRIADATLGERRISGVFDSADPQSFVNFLESVFPVQVERPSVDEVVVRTQP